VVLPPITQLQDVSIDNRADIAHQQMLAYAKDMAHAVASQLKMKEQMKQIKALSLDLSKTLEHLSTAGPDSPAYTDALSQARSFVQELVELSKQNINK
jgi:hypothetical protein